MSSGDLCYSCNHVVFQLLVKKNLRRHVRLLLDNSQEVILSALITRRFIEHSAVFQLSNAKYCDYKTPELNISMTNTQNKDITQSHAHKNSSSLANFKPRSLSSEN